MKEIEFHFNVPDKLQYGCRLLRKVYRNGMQAVVTGDPEILADLDGLLWRFSSTEFLPHCMATAQATMTEASPILLASRPEPYARQCVLINIGQNTPAGFEGFERFIELVSEEAVDRQAGRERWKDYKAKGFELKRHDVTADRPVA